MTERTTYTQLRPERVWTKPICGTMILSRQAAGEREWWQVCKVSNRGVQGAGLL